MNKTKKKTLYYIAALGAICGIILSLISRYTEDMAFWKQLAIAVGVGAFIGLICGSKFCSAIFFLGIKFKNLYNGQRGGVVVHSTHNELNLVMLLQ